MRDDKIKIGALTYKIRYVDSNELPDNEVGQICLETGSIKILKTLANEQKKVTLWHEIFHALNSELLEETVEFLAQAIYMILYDNPELNKIKNERSNK